MSACQCQGVERLFSRRIAERDLEHYHRKGADKSTRVLIEALKSAMETTLTDKSQATLLDIGGGVGAIQYELLAAGLPQAIDVDASQAYLSVAEEEATRRGYGERIQHYHGNFAQVAPQLPPCELASLDRVICCYDDLPELLGASLAKTGQVYGLVFPRDTWWMKLGRLGLNSAMWLTRNTYRFFVHPTSAVDALIQQHGFRPHFHKNVGVWQVRVYVKP